MNSNNGNTNTNMNTANDVDYETLIKKEWKVSNLADVETNLTTTSYRKRVHGDNRPPPKRRFVPGIVIETESEEGNIERTSREEAELTERDQQALEWRINTVNTKFNAISSMLDVMFNLYRLGNSSLASSPQQQENSLNLAWNEYNEMMRQVNRTRTNEVERLRDFYSKGKFKKGHFHKYNSYVICQPGARRRRYGDDDGYRTIIAHENSIKNILTEERLYYQYYGVPITD